MHASLMMPKSHICPPSSAIHPADRWESLFVYSFICRFTNLRYKVEGLESPIDLEEALMSKEPNPILSEVLATFIINLKPQTRNLSTDQISTTLANYMAEVLKTSERTVFWNEELMANVDPFENLEGGFFATDWDFKLKVLRQLVDLQLVYSLDIKAAIDRAWGVQHNKHKKSQVSLPPLDPADSMSREKLSLLPIGQDSQRKRYWVADDSPRIYISTNPWKTTSTFETISTTRQEYLEVIENLKAGAPSEPRKGQKRTRPEAAHLGLIKALEDRVEAIDTELARVQKIRRKIEQKKQLLAQAEIRKTRTRTRARAQKPDYVYNNDFGEDDGTDEYTYQDDDEQDDEYEQESLNDGYGTRRGKNSTGKGTRRSARNMNGKRAGSSDSALWRGERRSSRLAGTDVLSDEDPPRKRARTEDSSTSRQSIDPVDNVGISNGVRLKAVGAAALKPTEVAMEEIAGRKKSKFWVYAVEPTSDPEKLPSPYDGNTTPPTNGHTNGMDVDRS